MLTGLFFLLGVKNILKLIIYVTAVLHVFVCGVKIISEVKGRT
jgi:hypothetical protein